MIWLLVVSASPTAARTTSVVRVSCALISAIELDSSPAAAAAVSTLAEASFEACDGGRRALRGLVGRAEQPVGGVAHGADAVR